MDKEVLPTIVDAILIQAEAEIEVDQLSWLVIGDGNSTSVYNDIKP